MARAVLSSGELTDEELPVAEQGLPCTQTNRYLLKATENSGQRWRPPLQKNRINILQPLSFVIPPSSVSFSLTTENNYNYKHAFAV